MTLRLSFHPFAEIELTEAALYYEQQSRGLGRSFLFAVERCTVAIQELPDAGTPLDATVRRRLVEGSPYGILYRATADGIRILAVIHLKRRPFYWCERA